MRIVIRVGVGRCDRSKGWWGRMTACGQIFVHGVHKRDGEPIDVEEDGTHQLAHKFVHLVGE
jgi:hypothetical protein